VQFAFADDENRCEKQMDKTDLGGQLKIFTFSHKPLRCQIYLSCFLVADVKVTSVGDGLPEKCQFYFDVLSWRKLPCLVKEAAKECRDKGGDEIYTYLEKPKSLKLGDSYTKFACCQSKTPEQKEKAAKKKESCMIGCDLVNDVLD
jgi:hypothetical protein